MGRFSHRPKQALNNLSMFALTGQYALSGIAASLKKGWRMIVPGAIPYPTTLGQPALGKPPPVWSSVPSFSLAENGTGYTGSSALGVSAGGAVITISWVSTPITGITFTSGVNPTIVFTNVAVQSGTAITLRATANGQTVNSSAGSVTVSASTPAPSGDVLSFSDIPSLQDETNFYALKGWTILPGASSIDFANYGAISTGYDVHNDGEGDDLWVWTQQIRRGHPGGTSDMARLYRDQWLAYHKNFAVSDTLNDDYGFDFCHVYGVGGVLYGTIYGDTAAIAASEGLGDLAIDEYSVNHDDTTVPGAGTQGTGASGGRGIARWGQLFAWLLWSTGKAKWAKWFNGVLTTYMTSPDWEEVGTRNIQAGGWYPADINAIGSNYEYGGYVDDVIRNYANGPAAYNAGRRTQAVWQLSLHAEFLWRAYLLTGRADVRDRLIKIARFVYYYAYTPSHTTKFAATYFGHENGARYRREAPNTGVACYESSLVNIMLFGYKLTSDATEAVNFKTRAHEHFRNATRWKEGEPGSLGSAPQCATNEVWYYIDTMPEHLDSRLLNFNKGQLRETYLIFENGGNPTNHLSNVPTYMNDANLPAGQVVQLASMVSSVFPSFTGRYGEGWGVYAYSGACYDSKRGMLLRTGGGHADWNGNEVYGLNIFAATPQWSLVKDPTSPPSETSPLLNAAPAADTLNGVVGYTNSGDPAASHTWNNLCYDVWNDRLIIPGCSTYFSQQGWSDPYIRELNLAPTPKLWLARDAAYQLPAAGANYNGAFSYDKIEHSIYGRGNQQGEGGLWLRIDCKNRAVSTLSVSGTGIGTQLGGSSCALDPIRRYMIFIGGDAGRPQSGMDMTILDLSSRVGNNVTGASRMLTGFPSALLRDKMGLEFHPPTGWFVAWPANGTTVYLLKPPANPLTGAWTFEQKTVALPSNVTNGVYNGFRWAPYPHDPSRGVFVIDVLIGTYGVDMATRTYIYKPNF